MPTRKRGRPLEWPKAWREFAEKLGGVRALSEGMGYRGHNTLANKVYGRSPWSKGDRLLLSVLAKEAGFDFSRLFPNKKVESRGMLR
jgi:hypothetical protein